MIFIRKLITGLVLFFVIVMLAYPYLADVFLPIHIRSGSTVVRLFVYETGNIIQLPLEDYVTGVVAAEMPAEFPAEALKAQAVAARTYILKRLKAGGVINTQHSGADVSDNCREGQAWISEEEMKKRWGKLGYYRYYYKIRQAVDETRGLAITCQGQLIEPVYHSSCGGKGTENASDVWKVDEPYLKGVTCPYDADPQPVRVVRLSPERVTKALKVNLNVIPAIKSGEAGETASLMKVIDYTSSGRPKTVLLGEKTYPAAIVRDLLGLRSNDFDLKIDPKEVEVTTRGYGHAVGMCQYGAKGFAQHGYNYKKILKHYYSGVEIRKI